MHSIKTRIIVCFILMITLLGLVISFFGYYTIKTNIVERAQKQMRNDLRAARCVYENEQELIRKSFELVSFIDNPSQLKSKLNLDYLFVVERETMNTIKSEIVRRAFAGNGTGGTRIIDSTELLSMSETLYRRALIAIQSTPRARPTNRGYQTSAMVMEYAQPYFDQQGQVIRVMYGGKIINRYFDLIDRIHDIVYESRTYKGKPLGTVTIFLDDVRIATNVINRAGERAIGTRVSEAVYHNVVEKGKPWYDRAFVVTDWYLTAYEPIRDISGKITGILYVGILEQPFKDLIRSTLFIFIIIMGSCTVLAIVLSFILANGISSPLTRLMDATTTIAAGDLSHRVPNFVSIREIHVLSESFNEMIHKLDERDKKLTQTNSELEVINKRYIDLVGMVSHELKGILSSTVLNAYTVRDGYLGELNEKQKKALDSVTRNLEYFDLSVKNFLNLSRIEKGELSLSRTDLHLKEDLIDASVDAFSRQAQERHIIIEEQVQPGITINGDSFLLLTVVNNLIGNAIKYGRESGKILITATAEKHATIVDIYNEGIPLRHEDLDKLFRRFSRLEAIDHKKVRGTGLGLFLSKEIIERHGGLLWCEPREHGNAFLFRLPSSPEKPVPIV